jgi:hypothetical protein
MLGEVIAVIEMVVIPTIIGTALFGSTALSERASVPYAGSGIDLSRGSHLP